MARRTGLEPRAPWVKEPRFVYLQHHYMRGLRFDGLWSYPIKTPAGRWRWKALPLLEAPCASAAHEDPEGVGWCLRRCIAFLAQRGLETLKQPNGNGNGNGYVTGAERTPRLATGEVVNLLQAGLPGYVVQALEIGAAGALADLAMVLSGRGSALLRLERAEGNRGIPSAYWVWVVGVETVHQDTANGAKPSAMAGLIHALLVVGPRWPAPWGSGFGARVLHLADGSWKLTSVDGEVLGGRLTAQIAVRPVEVD